MRSSSRRFAVATLAALLVASAWSRCEAALITYTEVFTATGTLNGSSYSNAIVTLTATGDTNDVVGFGGSGLANPVSVAVSVDGVGSDSLAGPYIVSILYYPSLFASLVGIQQGTPSAPGATLLLVSSRDAIGYDLMSDLPAVSGGYAFDPNRQFATGLGGSFTYSQIPIDDEPTFQAQLGAVPEPSSLTLCGLGIACLASGRSIRARTASGRSRR